MRFFNFFLILTISNLCLAQVKTDTSIRYSLSTDEYLRLTTRLDALETEFLRPQSEVNGLQLGLSFGFNGYINGPSSYYIKADSTLGAFGSTRGVTGIISALIGYRIKPNHVLYLNLPLSDISANESATFGIFNRRIAGGMGYGYSLGPIALIAVVNIFPYEEPALDLIEGKKYEHEPLTNFEIENVPTVGRISPSLTLGFCYQFIKGDQIPSLMR